MQDGYTVRDQVLCDLLHVFNVTLRAYEPLHAASTGRGGPGSSACACALQSPCSCLAAAGLKLSHLQADAQARPLPCLFLEWSTVFGACEWRVWRAPVSLLSRAAHDTMPLMWASSGRSSECASWKVYWRARRLAC